MNGESAKPTAKTDKSLEAGPFDKLRDFFNELIPWHKLPTLLGLVRVLRIRDVLRNENLHDTSHVARAGDPPPLDDSVRHDDARTIDGSFNDKNDPHMGAAGTRFGRNVPLQSTIPEPEPQLLSPSPRVVSRELMTRKEFQPAKILNLLAAAWIQFQVHDWFSHGKNEKEKPWKITLTDDDNWPGGVMEIRRTRKDPTRDPNSNDPIPTFINVETHWWDASQIYGSTKAVMDAVRSGMDGKLVIGNDGLLPISPVNGVEITGVTGNWWIGLAMLHTLFTLEHNAICNKLRDEFPDWSDEDLYVKARLINSALIAKIHTVDWTPAILPHPTTARGVPVNWWGLGGEDALRRRGRLEDNDVLSGVPGSETDHHTAPYAMTDEFVFRSIADNAELAKKTLPEVAGRDSRPLLEQVSMANAFYSFGVSFPGAIQLHNYPKFLQTLERETGPTVDLASMDILRDRERGTPRYNEFRKLMHMKPVESFEELTEDAEWREEIRKVYDNDINRVDVMVGMYAEKPPEGFGFSDTAFRVFILMASRRLKSDRFLSKDYRPEIYTQTGIDWVEQNNMRTVLLRHFPELQPSMGHLKNAFAPWRQTQSQTFPIILAHGVARFDILTNDLFQIDNNSDKDELHYFRNIRTHVEANGFDVHHTNVEWAGPVDVRADQLKQQVESILADTGAEKVHIIAHSMGGLDARHMLFNNRAQNFQDKVASVTTIATPHHGSPFADFLVKNPSDPGVFGLALPAVQDLTTAATKAFNDQAGHWEKTAGLRFRAYAGSQSGANIFSLLKFSWMIIRDEEGDNDGFVSVKSARWNDEYFVEPVIDADHLNEIGWWDLSEESGPEELETRIKGLYLRIAQDLRKEFPVSVARSSTSVT